MPHVTFVHGIGNKPAADQLLSYWCKTLAQSGGVDLGAAGVTSSIVYWADVLYGRPLPQPVSEDALLGQDRGAEEFVEGADLPAMESAEEVQFVAGLAAKIGAVIARSELEQSAESITEIPLPWPIKKKLLEAFIRDAHHYLFNVEHSPRPGAKYRVRDEIRRRFVEAVTSAPSGRPHLVVGHSLGSVIAYDCLKNVGACGSVDALVSIGSPLGLDEIQDRLGPGYSSTNGFPSERLNGRWWNLSDRLDPICGFDPKIGADYRQGGQEVVIDEIVVNSGWWRHAAVQYLARLEVRGAIKTGLGI